MIRRRSTPWIHRWSRFLIAGIAACGALTTGYITIVKFSQGSAACPTKSCDLVLASDYAEIFGIPLALFGLLAYLGMAGLAIAPIIIKNGQNKKRSSNLEDTTWLLLLVGAIAMTVFSGYLMYLLFFKIQSLCIYCIASALFSSSMLVLTIIGRTWEDVGQVLFTALIVGIVTLVGTLGVYANVGNPAPNAGSNGDEIVFRPNTKPTPPNGWDVTTTSGEAEIQLAKHLKEIGAKKYSAWWCPHCYEQKQLFGKEAVSELPIVECAPQGKNPQPEVCQAAGIEGFPTWKINGQSLSGVQSLEKLAEVSGYKGPRNFEYAPQGS